MRIDSEQLQQHLTRGLKPLYTVFGDEPLLALEAGDRIRAAARAQGYSEREVLTVDSGFRWSELAMAASSQSLFAVRRLLELRIPSGKPGTDGSSALQSFVERLPADTVTLIQLPEIDWRSQKSVWFEALQESGVAVEARVIARKALPQWLAGRLRAQGQQADRDTLEFIADRVEGNLMAAYQEVQKLALLFPAGTITQGEVRDAVLDVARYDVFDIGEVMVANDAARLARMLEGLKGEGTAAPLVLWALAEEIRAIGTVLSGIAAGKPMLVVMREARIRGAAHQSLMQANVRHYTAALVEDALRHAGCIDRMVKGLAKGDVWDELLQLGLRFARPALKPMTRAA
jgi:DNA polymerase III subunit delta